MQAATSIAESHKVSSITFKNIVVSRLKSVEDRSGGLIAGSKLKGNGEEGIC